MRRLTKPSQDSGETFELCVSRVRNRAMKQRLQAARPRVERAAIDYDAKAQLGQWFSVPQSGTTGGVPREEFLKTYKSRMAKPDAPGRPIYDKLMIAPQRRCPLCGQRDVSTLDHYLPEAHYSLLVVSPQNLVPCCKDCNFKKLEAVPISAETQTIHPYYDNFDDATWLSAKLVDVRPISVLFGVVRPGSWNATKAARAHHHFETLELGDLYSSHAAGELIEIKRRLIDLYDAGGAEAIREDLASTSASITAVYRNSWRGALYSAAASTDWFCDTGFRGIAD